MNKPLFALVAIVAIVILGAGAYLAVSNKSEKPKSPEAASVQKEDNKKSIKDLLSAGSSQKCTYSDKNAENVDVVGTVYLANGKMRGDINSTVAGKAYVSHMIKEGNTFYTWIDGQTTGFKMTVNPDYSSADANKSVDLNKVIDYNCSSWSADNSLFVLPKGVSFGEGAMGPAATGAYDKCSACSGLPASSQAQCKAALKC